MDEWSMRQPLRSDRSLRRKPSADNGNGLHSIRVRQESSGIQNAVVYSLKLGLTVFGYAVCYPSSEVDISNEVNIMMQAASSMRVKDDRSGKLLLSMRFTGLADALDYLSHAQLFCEMCRKHFGARSTTTMMSRGDSWELMLPHHCELSPPPTQEASSRPEAYA